MSTPGTASPQATPQHPITTAFSFPEYDVERTIGTVFGLVVRSMGMAEGIGASFRALAGGEVGQYTKLLEDRRRHTIDRLVDDARALGANGIVAMRFDSSEIGQSLTEIAAYGTAVILTAKTSS